MQATLLNGFGAWPDGVPMGPPTPRKPSGERLWICQDYAHLGPGRACVAMYGGPEAGHPEYPNVLGEMKALQRAINAYITKFHLSTPKLVVDGTPGPKTLGAYQLVAQTNSQLPQQNSVDDLTLATWNQKLYNVIAGLAGVTVSTSIDKLSDDQRGTLTVNKAQAPQRASGPAPGDEPSQFPTWAWWLIGGASAVGVVALGYSLYRHKHRPHHHRIVRVRPHIRVL